MRFGLSWFLIPRFPSLRGNPADTFSHKLLDSKHWDLRFLSKLLIHTLSLWNEIRQAECWDLKFLQLLFTHWDNFWTIYSKAPDKGPLLISGLFLFDQFETVCCLIYILDDAFCCCFVIKFCWQWIHMQNKVKPASIITMS